MIRQKEQVNAMKTLLNHYQKQLKGQETTLEDCPLCIALEHHECEKCVWVLETFKDCNKFKYHTEHLREGITYIPKQTLTKWKKKRIKELKLWIKKYDK